MCCRSSRLRHTRLAAASLVALVAFAGCGAVDAPAPAGDQSATSDTRAGSAGGKADIYGEDGRREYYQTESATLRRVADASALLVDAERLDASDDDRFVVDETTLEQKRGVCERERFSQQPAPGDCSGFLVRPDTVVTAGHCITADECDRTRLLFGFRYEEHLDERITVLPADDVYRCERVVHRRDVEEGADFAILELDRPVSGRTPVEFRRTGEVAEGTPLAMVGHPIGLPLKVDPDGRVIEADDETSIDYNLDTYGGNSGSAVVDPRSGVVEAVHVHGTPDFRPDLERSCLVSQKCTEVVPETRCRGNGGTRATAFAPFVLPEAGDDGTYRFTDEDDTLARTDRTISAEIYVPAIGEIDALRVVTRIGAEDDTRVGLRLVRGTESGGEVVRLLRGRAFDGTWRRNFPVAKFRGREAEGIWRIVVEAGEPDRLAIEELALEIRPE